MIIPPKDSAINAASTTFGATERQKWLPLLVGSEVFRRAQVNFADVKTRLDVIPENPLQAQQLNAAYRAIDRLGAINASTSGADGTYSIAENREGLIEYALTVIYGAGFQPAFALASSRVRIKPVF